MQKPRAVGLLPVCLTVKPVGEPDALIGHVRFDEGGWEPERCRSRQRSHDNAGPWLGAIYPFTPRKETTERSIRTDGTLICSQPKQKFPTGD